MRQGLLVVGGMRRVKTVEDCVPRVASPGEGAGERRERKSKGRKSLNRSVGDIPVSKTYLTSSGLALLAAGAASACFFFFVRSSVVAKGLSVVPPLCGFIWLQFRRAHLGVSPVAWLALALALHGAGDVVIKLFGVVQSMPFFLLGHVLYCRAFARGNDISFRRLRQFRNLKKAALVAAVLFAALFWFLLNPSFEGPLKVRNLKFIFFSSLSS